MNWSKFENQDYLLTLENGNSVITEKIEGCRVANDGFIYDMRKKPTEDTIRDLRYIKKVRMANKLKDDIKPQHPLNSEVLKLLNMRGYNREILISEIAKNFISILKDRDNLSFTFEQINILFEGINKNTANRLKTQFIKLLKELKLIEEYKFNKTYYTYELKPLLTFEKFKDGKLIKVDCGSNISIARHPHKRKVIVYNLI